MLHPIFCYPEIGMNCAMKNREDAKKLIIIFHLIYVEVFNMNSKIHTQEK